MHVLRDRCHLVCNSCFSEWGKGLSNKTSVVSALLDLLKKKSRKSEKQNKITMKHWHREKDFIWLTSFQFFISFLFLLERSELREALLSFQLSWLSAIYKLISACSFFLPSSLEHPMKSVLRQGQPFQYWGLIRRYRAVTFGFKSLVLIL